MKELSIKIVANRSPWVEKMIPELTEWFLPHIKFYPHFTNTQFWDIPFTKYNEKGWEGVDPSWYDKNITPLGKGFDILLFVVPTVQWKITNGARGWRGDKNGGPVELQIACDEFENVYKNGVLLYKAFISYATHEITHALYMLTGQADKTHYWFDLGTPKESLKEIRFETPKYAEIIRTLWAVVADIQRKIIALKKNTPMPSEKPNEKIKKFCLAIQEQEGYFPESRSYRNNNPGNCKFSSVGYLSKYGDVKEDRKGIPSGQVGFAIFPTYEQGFLYLQNFIIGIARGENPNYNRKAKQLFDLPSASDLNLFQFFSIYAPSEDDNDPENYARKVAKNMDMPVTTKIKEVLS